MKSSIERTDCDNCSCRSGVSLSFCKRHVIFLRNTLTCSKAINFRLSKTCCFNKTYDRFDRIVSEKNPTNQKLIRLGRRDLRNA